MYKLAIMIGCRGVARRALRKNMNRSESMVQNFLEGATPGYAPDRMDLCEIGHFKFNCGRA